MPTNVDTFSRRFNDGKGSASNSFTTTALSKCIYLLTYLVTLFPY